MRLLCFGLFLSAWFVVPASAGINCPPNQSPTWVGNLDPPFPAEGTIGSHHIDWRHEWFATYENVTISYGKYWINAYTKSKEGPSVLNDDYSHRIQFSSAKTTGESLTFEHLGWSQTRSESWCISSESKHKLGPYNIPANEIVQACVKQMVYRIDVRGTKYAMVKSRYEKTIVEGLSVFHEGHRIQRCL